MVLAKKKNCFWSNLVNENKNKPKQLWTTLNKILCKDTVDDINNTDTIHNSDGFLKFFEEKIEQVRETTSGESKSGFLEEEVKIGNEFSAFPEYSEEDVIKIILICPTKTSSLDCLPTHFFKKHIRLFSKFLTGLINLCLINGIVPTLCKHAVVIPLLKRPDSDVNDISNYRPVSNLRFISKVIEKIVAKELLKHLSQNSLLPTNQSGYRMYHSTETALLHICSTLCEAMDNQFVSLVAFLDMSAAFDCVDHDILLSRLSRCFGIKGAVISWFKSYLFNRTQQVLYRNILSETKKIKCGVPQGSVLGPMLFLLYTIGVLDIINSFGFMGHAFADDIQIIVSCPPNEFETMGNRFIRCLTEINEWMVCNRLKLNQSKTKLLPVGTWQQLSRVNISALNINNTKVEFCSNVSSLGVNIDSELTLEYHIKSLMRACTLHLRKLKVVKKSLNKDTLQMMMHAFIHSRLDYCNSLFNGLPEKSILMLQSIQNRAARVVSGALKYDHISPILKQLHWLTINKRVMFKTCVLIFKCINNLAPKYLTDRIKHKIPHHVNLRSNELNFLMVQMSQLKIGSRNFAVLGPRIWNNLPSHLRDPSLNLLSFRKLLKTYLFSM